MQNNIPLPTDNIYKFCALFGLVLIIFSISCLVYVQTKNNAFVFDIAVEYTVLEEKKVRNTEDEARYLLLKRMLEVASEDKKAIIILVVIGICAGMFSALYGFRKWHSEYQYSQDEITRLTIKKLKREIGEDA